MRTITDPHEMQLLSLASRREGKRIVFVPTMGYLHQGHASLLREARRSGDLLVLSIFVNPRQFGPTEDLERYPRDMERDSAIAAEAGVDVIFAPSAEAMYPQGYQTSVDVKKLTLPLCGASRPGHFEGVTTVVAKLFNIVQPDAAYFGKKDFQQLAIIRRMVADLNMPIKIVGMPIVREPDGLALSSRNVYLSAEERKNALALVHSLRKARELYRSGERDIAALRGAVLAILTADPTWNVDYADFRNSDTLEEVTEASDDTLIALAVRIGKTRLIDNTLLGEEE